MKQRRALSIKQEALLSFLVANRGSNVTLDEVVAASGYGPQSIATYISKFDLGVYLRRKSDGSFLVTDSADFSQDAFSLALTQSNSVRQVGSKCRNRLAKALVRKSRDNMILALELYNRPSLENRLDAFSILFCTAWEQLLKAEIIESSGEAAIFRAQKPGRRRESISLEEALVHRFSESDGVRANVSRIAELRHGATHLLMPEVQGVLSLLFQAGILNFSRRFAAVAGSSLLPQGASGLLSVVGDWAPPDMLAVKQLYGVTTASEIDGLIREIGESIEKSNDKDYAVSVSYRLVLSKSPADADIKLTTSPTGDKPALIVEKAVSAERTHPHLPMEVVNLVAARCKQSVNSYDVQCAIWKEKWRSGNNEYHHCYVKMRRHTYSDKCVEELVRKVNSDPDYIRRARESYASSQRSATRKKS